MDEQTTIPMDASGKKNPMMPMAVAGLIILLVVAGGAYAMRHQLKAMFMGPTTDTTQSVPPAADTTSQTPAPSPDTAMQAKPSSDSAIVAKSVEVDYTATGFTPAKVTIKKGDTVKFVNKTTGPMSVASNPHPAHTDYPGFDQFKSASKGTAEYDFTFDKVGTWGYHNHIKAADAGIVVVTE